MYSLIYADPAWSYRDKCHSGKRGAGYKYDCMNLQDIFDVLPRLKHVGFWIQAATAVVRLSSREVKDGLTSPSPRVDAPTLRMFREAL